STRWIETEGCTQLRARRWTTDERASKRAFCADGWLGRRALSEAAPTAPRTSTVSTSNGQLLGRHQLKAMHSCASSMRRSTPPTLPPDRAPASLVHLEPSGSEQGG